MSGAIRRPESCTDIRFKEGWPGKMPPEGTFHTVQRDPISNRPVVERGRTNDRVGPRHVRGGAVAKTGFEGSGVDKIKS